MTTNFVNFEVENKNLDVGCYDALVLFAKKIKMSYQTKHLNILDILLYKKKDQNDIYLNKNI